jgi:hypothetical protein
MDFVLLYPRGKTLFIEIVCDKYIAWQPLTEHDIDTKVKEVLPIIIELKEYCETRGLSQNVIINFEKAIHFEKINFLLTAKLVRAISVVFPEHTLLKKIEFHHVSQTLKTIYDTVKCILPKKIKDVISIISEH